MKNKYCDKAYYGNKVNNCGNTIRGLDEVLAKMSEQEKSENED